MALPFRRWFICIGTPRGSIVSCALLFGLSLCLDSLILRPLFARLFSLCRILLSARFHLLFLHPAFWKSCKIFLKIFKHIALSKSFLLLTLLQMMVFFLTLICVFFKGLVGFWNLLLLFLKTFHLVSLLF